MRQPKDFDADPSGFCSLRTPLLPFDVLVEWSKGLTAVSASEQDIASALDSDHRLLAQRLAAIIGDPVVRESLFVASPSLASAAGAWLEDPQSDCTPSVVQALTRYLVRMCARPMPFGLFSGCSVAPLETSTRLTLAPRSRYRRHTRLDARYLAALCGEIEKDPRVRGALLFRPSSGLFRSGDQFRYPESRVDLKTGDRSYAFVSVERSPYLQATLDRAAVGATAGALAQALVEDDASVSSDEAIGYIDQLIDSQILVSPLTPPVTGGDPIEDVAGTLRGAGGERTARRLSEVARALDSLDADGLGLPSARYRAITVALDDLECRTQVPCLFHVDLFKPAPGSTFGAAPLQEMERAVAVLARFTRRRSDGELLRRFCDDFVDRYGTREVPLVEALDEERGIGFENDGSIPDASTLLQDLTFPPPEPPAPHLEPREQWLLRQIAAIDRGAEWRLDDRDVAVLEGDAPPMPDAFSVLGRLAARSPESLDRGEFSIWIQDVMGPSGATLLGRFCHGDGELRQLVESHLRSEERLRPAAIFAEVVHLPDGRDGNVLCRPQLRRYEIPYLGRSGAAQDQQILLSDLQVSIRDARVVLRSNRLNREVIPRLTSAHAFSTANLGTYRFLCALQLQEAGQTNFGWSWGSVQAIAPYLPRVVLGRAILSLATWNLDGRDLRAVQSTSRVERFRAVQALRRRLRLPRWVAVIDRDHNLPVDLDNALQVDSLVALTKAQNDLVIQEMFPAPDEMCVRGPEGLFVHELIVPFVRNRPSAAVDLVRRPTLTRSFPPGTEWLYAKIYTGPVSADRVLSKLVAPLVNESIERGDTQSWFFVRYRDPHWHLRVRFQGDPQRLTTNVIPRLYHLARPMLADGTIWRISLDTYERELERYGGDEGMPLCEAIFHADSEAALSIHQRMSMDEAPDLLWRLALRGMHVLLTDLGLTAKTRLDLVSSLRSKFATEHRVHSAFEKKLGDKFRKERATLESMVWTGGGDQDSPISRGFWALDRRSKETKPIAGELSSLEERRQLTPTLPEIAASLLHMHANRMLRAAQRTQEFVLYDFLKRVYEGDAARARNRHHSH